MDNYVVMITDCDHDSIEIEEKIINNVTNNFKLLNCKTEEDIIENCREADALITQYGKFTRKVLSQLPKCKIIVRYGVGVDSIDLDAATEFNIQVCNVPDYGLNEVSDQAIALMMALTRKVPLMTNSVKNGLWKYEISKPIFRLQEQVAGVIGLGRIGNAFAKKAHGLGFKIIGFDPNHKRLNLPDFIELVEFEDLVKKSDVISIHCPLQENTKNLIDEAELKEMKSTAYIVNTARGGIINEEALDKALTNKWIAGAGLDVIVKEEADLNNPLFKHESFLCTPHMAWYSEQAFDELKRKVAEQVVSVLKGEKPAYPVNKIN
ncbi:MULTISPECIES: C-terminal binding protein [Bacteria]|uniref:C-terminal binding protein n=1 Tax=Bacteria TaxID=2 RepID=UPI0012B165E3|nr:MULTISPECIES: C-terminal binding protein [Bacteria]MRY42719.1 C-terminal binding protein [Parabacteroides distasonis]MZK52057.1 C-terminal binding protein [Clostridium beijerinckii]MZK60198.1 C-terminal binding protein [Clostridium beijerinckii]MZK70483.1 C-terminal binding protein [Clostridium beijerinckii]MZK75785.1 C-terminal binding protein [Clostridium beijerinckii]